MKTIELDGTTYIAVKKNNEWTIAPLKTKKAAGGDRLDAIEAKMLVEPGELVFIKAMVRDISENGFYVETNNKTFHVNPSCHVIIPDKETLK